MKKLNTKLPDTPGVYIFRGSKRAILYIGKATSLRTRVASYFRNDIMAVRGPILAGMIEIAKSIDFIETDSVLEAIILEAHLIKKHQPPYNTKQKDNKSFNYVVITDEDFPRVLIIRGREVENQLSTSFGPFPQGSVLREALKIIRKIFPFRDKCKINSSKPCFNAQIELCPGVCVGTVSKAEYSKTIKYINLFFEGKKKTIINGLEREMKLAVKNQKFELAGRIKKIIFALNHIQDVALLKENFLSKFIPSMHLSTTFRIEAYDVSHISGTNVVGSMVVIQDDELKKSDYRKFKIKTNTNDDNASLFEMLDRRFAHKEWQMPNLIVVDGGKAQINTTKKILKKFGLTIPVVGVVKDEHHKPKGFLGNGKIIQRYNNVILLANSEAHRFAVIYHRVLREKIK